MLCLAAQSAQNAKSSVDRFTLHQSQKARLGAGELHCYLNADTLDRLFIVGRHIGDYQPNDGIRCLASLAAMSVILT